jgi:hypothetical protein
MVYQNTYGHPDQLTENQLIDAFKNIRKSKSFENALPFAQDVLKSGKWNKNLPALTLALSVHIEYAQSKGLDVNSKQNSNPFLLYSYDPIDSYTLDPKYDAAALKILDLPYLKGTYKSKDQDDILNLTKLFVGVFLYSQYSAQGEKFFPLKALLGQKNFDSYEDPVLVMEVLRAIWRNRLESKDESQEFASSALKKYDNAFVNPNIHALSKAILGRDLNFAEKGLVDIVGKKPLPAPEKQAESTKPNLSSQPTIKIPNLSNAPVLPIERRIENLQGLLEPVLEYLSKETSLVPPLKAFKNTPSTFDAVVKGPKDYQGTLDNILNTNLPNPGDSFYGLFLNRVAGDQAGKPEGIRRIVQVASIKILKTHTSEEKHTILACLCFIEARAMACDFLKYTHGYTVNHLQNRADRAKAIKAIQSILTDEKFKKFIEPSFQETYSQNLSNVLNILPKNSKPEDFLYSLAIQEMGLDFFSRYGLNGDMTLPDMQAFLTLPKDKLQQVVENLLPQDSKKASPKKPIEVANSVPEVASLEPEAQEAPLTAAQQAAFNEMLEIWERGLEPIKPLVEHWAFQPHHRIGPVVDNDPFLAKLRNDSCFRIGSLETYFINFQKRAGDDVDAWRQFLTPSGANSFTFDAKSYCRAILTPPKNPYEAFLSIGFLDALYFYCEYNSITGPEYSNSVWLIVNKEKRNEVVEKFKTEIGWGTVNYSQSKRDKILVDAEFRQKEEFFGVPNNPRPQWGDLFPEVVNNVLILETLNSFIARSPKSREEYQKISVTPLFTPLSEEAADKIRGGIPPVVTPLVSTTEGAQGETLEQTAQMESIDTAALRATLKEAQEILKKTFEWIGTVEGNTQSSQKKKQRGFSKAEDVQSNNLLGKAKVLEDCFIEELFTNGQATLPGLVKIAKLDPDQLESPVQLNLQMAVILSLIEYGHKEHLVDTNDYHQITIDKMEIIEGSLSTLRSTELSDIQEDINALRTQAFESGAGHEKPNLLQETFRSVIRAGLISQEEFQKASIQNLNAWVKDSITKNIHIITNSINALKSGHEENTLFDTNYADQNSFDPYPNTLKILRKTPISIDFESIISLRVKKNKKYDTATSYVVIMNALALNKEVVLSFSKWQQQQNQQKSSSPDTVTPDVVQPINPNPLPPTDQELQKTASSAAEVGMAPTDNTTTPETQTPLPEEKPMEPDPRIDALVEYYKQQGPSAFLDLAIAALSNGQYQQ